MKALVTVQNYGTLQMQIFAAIVLCCTMLAAGKAAKALPAQETPRPAYQPQETEKRVRAMPSLRREAHARAMLVCQGSD